MGAPVCAPVVKLHQNILLKKTQKKRKFTENLQIQKIQTRKLYFWEHEKRK
jgi:hypothetical protein